MDHIAVAVTFAYMWSAHQHLGPPGAWHPHMMVFAPNYDNAMVGGFAFGSPLPQLSDGLPAAGDGRARFRGRERERLPNLRADAKRHPVGSRLPRLPADALLSRAMELSYVDVALPIVDREIETTAIGRPPGRPVRGPFRIVKADQQARA